jgi:hypothetical protein
MGSPGSTWRVDFGRVVEAQSKKALRVLPRPQPPRRIIYSGGKRYVCIDANAVVEAANEADLGRPGHIG